MQALLSEHWHAVRFLRPRLREGVKPLHRVLRGRPWVLLLDPATQRFHRLSPSVWQVVALLDGRRTLDEVWDDACAAAATPANGAEPDGPISQHELVQLLASLHANDLLQTQVSPDAAEVFERYRRQRRARLKQAWLNPMGMKLALLHPDAWFNRHHRLARAMFSPAALVLWLLLVAPAAFLAWQHWQGLTQNLSDRVLAASNVALLWLTYPIVKAVHEWAHGMAVKAWGGAVREMGLMFIVFTPVPYVDASASYRFPSKWSRAAVAAAGMMAELALGAIALYVWVAAEQGLVRAVAFNVVLIAGVSTLLVNGNPLMRYDGYFIACDLLESPNLSQRATQYWTWLIDRYAFGVRSAQPPLGSERERWLLVTYGLVAPLYRLGVSLGLAWFVAAQYPLVGVVMALFTLWSAMVMPAWKGFKHLSDGATLGARREIAIRRSVAALVLTMAFVGLVPLPFHSVHQGVVWVPDEAVVRAAEGGEIQAALADPGERITPGGQILTLASPTLLAELQGAAATVARTRARLRQAEVDDLVQAQSLRAELIADEARLAEAQRRVEALQVRAAVAGVWTPAATTDLAGRFAKRGEVLGHLVDGPSRHVRTAVTQEDRDLIGSRLRGVEVRLSAAPRTPTSAIVRREVPGGEFELVSPALGTHGGGEIAVDPAQSSGTKTLARVFDLELELSRPPAQGLFGDRVHVRFDLGYAPLGWQAFLRLRQLFLGRLNV
jgi:putative peptide zinc metalloprotease protein